MFLLIPRLLLDLLYQAKYGWTEQEMATYLFDYRLGYMLSLWVLVPIMTNWLSLSDNAIAIIACLLSATGRRGICRDNGAIPSITIPGNMHLRVEILPTFERMEK